MEELFNTDACTLRTDQRTLRQAEFDALLAQSVSSVERRGGGVHLHLAGSPGLRDRVRDLVARETECCSFFTFTITGSDDSLRVDVEVPPERREVLDSLVARATKLSA